jgi:isopentenyl-diphosphate delta-isomerase
MIKSIIPKPLDIISSSCRTLSVLSNNPNLNFLNKYDPQQVTLLYEPLMIVDRHDQIIGQTTKKDAHLLSNIENEPSLIHRAFSFFLFDYSISPSRLILQQRSPEKITYPSLWANTCCSHPLYNNIEINGIDGVKHAVIRRIKYELGYEFHLDLIYLTRIFYQARNIPDDGIFGESEIDYIIIAKHKLNSKLDLLADFKLNQNEVKQIKSVTLNECEDLVQQGVTTPWFTKIVREGLLAKWWSTFDREKINKDGQQSDEIVQL